MVPAVPEAEGVSVQYQRDFLSLYCVPGIRQSASHTLSHLILRRAAAPTPSLEVLFLPPFYRWGKGSLEGWYNFPKATQLVHGRARIQIQASLTPRLRCFCVRVAIVSPLWESQEAVTLPGFTVEDDLEIYHVFFQVLLRLCPEIAGQSFKDLVYHYKITGSYCLSLGKTFWKPKLLCDGHSLLKSAFEHTANWDEWRHL